MNQNKVSVAIWDKIFLYPSLNKRFAIFISIFLIFFCSFTYFLVFKHERISADPTVQISVMNALIQGATLILGIFVAFYAVRQLAETRFTSLEQAGNKELKDRHYSRALEKWKEAFHIKPDVYIYLNMCESILLMEQYDYFDAHIKLSERKHRLTRKIITEMSDNIIVLYLKATRYLLVENQGEAKKAIKEIVELRKRDPKIKLDWDFSDLQQSETHQYLEGECKTISNNLILYLSQRMVSEQAQQFEEGNFTYIVTDQNH